MSDKYGAGGDRHYCYAGSDVLINKLDLHDGALLEAAEIELTQARIETFEPDFNAFSLEALQAIHRHLFDEIYSWAGELRTVDISKGTSRFATTARIEPEASKLFLQLERENYLVGLQLVEFTERLAFFYSELNVIHPFRDGNGRSLRLLFEVMSINAGYELRWHPISRDEWIDANISAYRGNLNPLIHLLARAITPI